MTKEEFFSRSKSVKPFTLKDGSTVHLKKLSQADVATLNRDYRSDDKAIDGYSFVVCQTVTDKDGKQLFSSEDMKSLAESDFETIKDIAEQSMTNSGLKLPKNSPA